MAIGGAFLGGGVEVVPAGSCKLELEILTEDRANLTATFTIKGTSTYTVTAGADGRAVYTVPAGQTYTVSVNTTGYDNIASQTVIAESGTVRYVRFEAFAGRVKRSGDTMTGTLAVVGGASIDTNGQVVGKKLRATADIHLGSSPSSYAVVNDGWIQNRTIDETKADLGVTGKQDRLTAGTNITISGTTISAKDTTYDVATQSANGLMSSADKTKLDGVDSALAGKVSKSGDTMAGDLGLNKLNPCINLINNVHNISTIPSSTLFSDIQFFDSTLTRVALLEHYRSENNRKQLALILNSSETVGVEDWSFLGLANDGFGTYAFAPSWSPGTNDNSDKILTIKMANSLPSLVHTTGNETIAGNKYFSNTTYHVSSQDITATRTGDTWISNNHRFLANNGAKNVARIQPMLRSDGSNELHMTIYNNDGVEYGLILSSSGKAYLTTHTPSTATGTEIVTANWSLSKFQRKITYGTGDPPSGGSAGDVYIKI